MDQAPLSTLDFLLAPLDPPMRRSGKGAGKRAPSKPHQLALLEADFLGRRITKEQRFREEMRLRRAQGLSGGLEAWVARERREELDLPLRACDREQITEQLEDMGTL